jgi:hypothetical protein
MRTVVAVAFRLTISASLAVSGVIHAFLYVNGYRDIPTIGPGPANPRRRTGLALAAAQPDDGHVRLRPQPADADLPTSHTGKCHRRGNLSACRK